MAAEGEGQTGGFPTPRAFFDTLVSENGRRKALRVNGLNFPTGFSRYRGVGKCHKA